MTAIRNRSTGRTSVLLVAIALSIASTAPAALIPTYLSQTISGSTTLLNYQVNFSSSGGTETLHSGDTLTLYDVGALSAFTVSSASYAGTTPFTGATPAGVAPTDSAALKNFQLTYNGATTSTDSVFTFTLTQATATPSTRLGQFTSSDSLAVGPYAHIGPVTLPTPVVPEPVTIGVVSAAAAFVGFARRRRA